MRHVTRTHRVDLDWLFERIRKDHYILIKYVNTKEQLADIFTKGSFSEVQWRALCKLMQLESSSKPLLGEIRSGSTTMLVSSVAILAQKPLQFIPYATIAKEVPAMHPADRAGGRPSWQDLVAANRAKSKAEMAKHSRAQAQAVQPNEIRPPARPW